MEKLKTDSTEYNILEEAIREIKNVSGMICEIGVRTGGSSELIIDTLLDNEDLDRHLICVDPYGDIPYPEGDSIVSHDYNNKMRDESLADIYGYSRKKRVNLHFLVLDDTEFFNRYTDGFPVYNKKKSILSKYALVFLDGPHSTEKINEEINFFKDKMSEGSIIVFDDIQMYNLPELDGFELIQKGIFKASYKKDKI